MTKLSLCMELDFDTVKALSSRTRVKILNEALENKSTPTDLSDAVGKSKSTVSSHLEKLQNAGLLEKDKVEGRRRVIYKPTSKTKAIIKGRNRKVKFSILSTVSTAWIGLGLGLSALNQSRGGGSDVGVMGVEGAQNASQFPSSEVFLFLGIGFFSISAAGLMYGLVISRLGNQK